MTSVTSPATASRGLKASPLQRISEIVLIVGTVWRSWPPREPSGLSVWGSPSPLRRPLVACAFAWRELNTARRTQAQAMLKATREHGEALTEERSRNAAVVETLSGGSPMPQGDREAAGDDCPGATADLQLEGRSALPGEVEYREKVISALRETVREREAELIALRDEPDAESTTCRAGCWPSMTPFGSRCRRR